MILRWHLVNDYYSLSTIVLEEAHDTVLIYNHVSYLLFSVIILTVLFYVVTCILTVCFETNKYILLLQSVGAYH